MEYTVEEIKYKGHTINIFIDEDCPSPRENDNLTEFHCYHPNYFIGDYQFDYPNAEKCVEAAIASRNNRDLVLPLYMYDHSGQTISLDNTRYPFTDPWDSMQIGFVVVRKKVMLENFGGKIFSKKLKEKALEIAKQEVEEMDSYMRGEAYGYRIDEDGDSCWGFIGDIKYCIDEAKASIF